MRLPVILDLSTELTPELRSELNIEQELPVLGFSIPNAGEMSGTQRKALIGEVRAILGASGLDYLDTQRLRGSERFLDLADLMAQKFREQYQEFVKTAVHGSAGEEVCRQAQAL
jgi:aspartyl-tRNA synthetase